MNDNSVVFTPVWIDYIQIIFRFLLCEFAFNMVFVFSFAFLFQVSPVCYTSPEVRLFLRISINVPVMIRGALPVSFWIILHLSFSYR